MYVFVYIYFDYISYYGKYELGFGNVKIKFVEI